MLGRTWARTVLCLVAALGLSAPAALGANILFISAMDPAMQPGDDALKAFLEGLGHTVTYLDDDAGEKETEDAAAVADLVYISESVGSAKVRLEIPEVAVPMVITEAWAYDEMGLTIGTGEGIEVSSTDIEIVLPGHPLAGGLTGTVTVLTDLQSTRGPARFSTGRASEDATVVAQATLSDGATYDVIWVYEKGAKLAVPPADGSPQVAADIRVCLGFDEQSYLVWNENAYTLFQAAINFGLGIRMQPQAYAPTPADGQTEVRRTTGLSWRAGTFARKHNVYFGTDFNDVNEATADDPRDVLLSENLDETVLDLRWVLDYGQTYYWRVDEVNDAPDFTVYKGDVWSFTVVNFLVVDDFESYTDDAGNRIFEKWIDGWGTTTNGAVVGYADPKLDAGEHFIETFIAHGGEQSMPFFYDNDRKYSEATLVLGDALRDWTQDDVLTLSLWFRGYAPYVGAFASRSGGLYDLTGAGADIWDNKDEFHFAFKEVTGAATIIAKVESVESTDPFAKAGVMIRDSLDPGARNVAIFVTPENGVRYQYRLTDKGATDRQFMEGLTAPYWVRLERTAGGLVRAYHSLDGAAWTQFTLQSAAMTMPVYVGLAVTSHAANVPCKATFSNVKMTGTGSEAAWVDQDVGLITNVPEPLYVVLNDSAVISHPDPDITVKDAWTQWVIPLQAFADQGVDLTGVETIGLGVGNRGDTTLSGGQGRLYFDDIRLYRAEP